MSTRPRLCCRAAPRRGGFTLLELGIVMAVIAVIVAMVLPALGHAREGARRTKCRHNLGEIAHACLTYADDYRGHLPWFRIGDGVSGAASAVYSYHMYADDAPCGFGLLYADGHDYNMWYCPSAATPLFAKETWEPYAMPATTPYSATHAGPVAGYLPMIKKADFWQVNYTSDCKGDRQIWDLDTLPGNASLFVDVVHREQYLPHSKDGVNVAFLDSHVSWYRRETLGREISPNLLGTAPGTPTTVGQYWALGRYFEGHP